MLLTAIVCVGILLVIAAGYLVGLAWVFTAEHPRIDKAFDKLEGWLNFGKES